MRRGSALEAELTVIEQSVETQERLLNQVNVELASPRERLRSVEEQYARGRRVLAAQLVADYESPQPTLVDVVLRARGFDDLLNGLSQLRSIARANANTVRLINTTRLAVAAETRRLVGILRSFVELAGVQGEDGALGILEHADLARPDVDRADQRGGAEFGGAGQPFSMLSVPK